MSTPLAVSLIQEPHNEVDAVDKYAWVILVVTLLASVSAPLNQFKVPPMMPALIEQFDLDLVQAGMLMSFFAFSGIVLAVPAGLFIIPFGIKRMGMVALASTIIGSALGALSNTFELLLISRVIEGVGMGLMVILAPITISMWFPMARRGLPMGIWAIWSPLATLIIYNAAPLVEHYYSWQGVWWVTTGYAVAVSILYLVFMGMPTSVGVGETSKEIPLRNLKDGFINLDLWLLSFTFACFMFVVISMVSFLPTFLTVEHDFSLKNASFIGSVPSIAVLVAAPLSGWVSDRIGSRKLVFTIPFILFGSIFIFFYNLHTWQFAAILFFAGFCMASIATAIFSSIPEVVKRSGLLGVGMAILAIGQSAGVLIGPILFGNMVEQNGWVSGGYLLLFISVLGVISGAFVKVR